MGAIQDYEPTALTAELWALAERIVPYLPRLGKRGTAGDWTVYGKKSNYEPIQERTSSSFWFRGKQRRVSCREETRLPQGPQAPMPARCVLARCSGWGLATWKHAISNWYTVSSLLEVATNAFPGFPTSTVPPSPDRLK